MRQVYRSQAPTAKPTATSEAEAPVRQPEHAEHAEPAEIRYSADEAAFAFGILRIAPVPHSGRLPRDPDSATHFPAEDEDFTESLTADARGAAEHGGQDREALAARAEQAEEQALRDPVTAALRMPSRPEPESRAEWGRARRPLLTERLAALPSPALAAPPAPRSRARLTALLPQLGRGPGESATTTLTLPTTSDSAAAPAATHDSLVPLQFRLSGWFAVGAGAALALVLAMLAGRALTLADWWPGARPPTVAPRPPLAGREHLLAQALTAVREGRREQAITLLLRYQASAPAGSPVCSDQAVPIMLRVLKKDLGPPAH